VIFFFASLAVVVTQNNTSEISILGLRCVRFDAAALATARRAAIAIMNLSMLMQRAYCDDVSVWLQLGNTRLL
jgi:hypothetical protein